MTLIVRIFADFSDFIRDYPPDPRYQRRIHTFSFATQRLCVKDFSCTVRKESIDKILNENIPLHPIFATSPEIIPQTIAQRCLCRSALRDYQGRIR